MKEMYVYDDELIPSRWRKEFEPAEDKEIPDITVTSAQVTKRKNNKASEPKTVTEKFNKALEVCRDMATFLSICGQKEFDEKLIILCSL